MLFDPINVKKLKPMHDYILVSDMVFTERLTTGGIILRGDDKKSEGIRPRWGQVYAVGPDQKEVTVGQWVCVAHGRWTRGVTIRDPERELTVRRVDNNEIMLVSDEKPSDDTLGEYTTP